MPYITVNGHRLHYTDTPPDDDSCKPDTPPLLMIHGLGSSQNYYYPILPGLSAYQCITIDTYGSARSKSHGEQLSLEGLCDDFLAVLEHLKIEKAIAIGHSMGGTAVCHMAATRPDRVAGLVCIGPVSPKHVTPEVFTKRIETVLQGQHCADQFENTER